MKNDEHFAAMSTYLLLIYPSTRYHSMRTFVFDCLRFKYATSNVAQCYIDWRMPCLLTLRRFIGRKIPWLTIRNNFLVAVMSRILRFADTRPRF